MLQDMCNSVMVRNNPAPKFRTTQLSTDIKVNKIGCGIFTKELSYISKNE